MYPIKLALNHFTKLNQFSLLEDPRTCKIFLIRTKQRENNNNEIHFLSSKCNRSRCSQCANIRESISFSSANTKEVFSLRVNTNCISTM